MAKKPKAAEPAVVAEPSLLDVVVTTLDDDKDEEIVAIDLRGRSSIADHMVVASGRSSRQVTALADQVASKVKDLGLGRVSIEGKDQGDWVLLDIGDVIVHIFRPEVREFYKLEKMWSGPTELAQAAAQA